MSIFDKLHELEEAGAFKSEVATFNRFAPIPDGKYNAKVEEARLEENKYTGEPQVTWKFQVIEGEYQGRYSYKSLQIDENKVSWLKQDFLKLGVGINSAGDIEEALEKVLDKCVEIALVTKA